VSPAPPEGRGPDLAGSHFGAAAGSTAHQPDHLEGELKTLTDQDTSERTAGGLVGKLAGKTKEAAGSLVGNDDLARAIPRAAIDSYLRLARLPLDTAIGLLPGNDTGAAPNATLALDRADATARALFGLLLGDPLLREDAQKRRAAANERERAIRLRVEAQRKTEQADSRLEQRHDEAARRRRSADQRANAQRAAAERKRDEQTRRAGESARKRRDASRRTAARGEQAVDERAPRARLETLVAKSNALREKEKALTGRDEARRLREAASRTKAERKADGG
jgi:hypothetical protein